LKGKSVLARAVGFAAVVVALAGAAVFLYARQPAAVEPSTNGRQDGLFRVSRRDFVRSIRLAGTVEAVESTTVSAPRLSGPNSNSLVITTLIRPGATVTKGDLIVEVRIETPEKLTEEQERMMREFAEAGGLKY